MPLYARVVLINGLVFALGILVLIVSPATVSEDPLLSELAVLVVGLAVILATNAVILRRTLAPYDAMVRHLRAEQDRTNAAMLAAQEEERLRISRELHDEVGQTLTVALLTLRSAADKAPPEVAEQIEESAEVVRDGLDSVRAVARRLRPGALDDLGLQPALTALARELEAAAGITVKRAFTPSLPKLSRDSELVVYRVAQEALTNVARHAGARRAELSLTKRGDQIVLEVSDDGRGFGSDEIEAGAGLVGMSERARLVGGTLTVTDRAPSIGVTVTLVLPTESAPGSAPYPGSEESRG